MIKRATLKDVAEKVGVTPATISMVINNNKSIPQVTRDKVFAAIKELGYYPNPIARNLVKGKSDTVAVITQFSYPQFFQQLLNGIEHVIAESNYGLHHMSSLRDQERFNDHFRSILSGRTADGVIMFNKVPDTDIIADFNRFGIPLVVIENEVPGVHSVTCNSFKGGYLAGEHLVKLGRKKIICISGIEDSKRSQVQQSRIAGFQKALSDNGLKPYYDNPVITDHYYFSEGKVVFNKYLKAIKGYDAIFCAAGDTVAIGLMGALQDNGMKVPGDVSLVGYDDLDFAAYVSPSLTTIRQPGLEMGQKAAELILKLLKDHSNETKEPERILFEPELIIRES